MKIDTSFPGGNSLITTKDNQFYIEPDLRDTNGSWFYWQIRVTHHQTEKIRVHLDTKKFTSNKMITFSTDKGLNWQWLKKELIGDSYFDFEYQEQFTEVRFCLSFPYTLETWKRFVSQYNNEIKDHESTWFTSKDGYDSPILQFKEKKNNTIKKNVIISARHHCCEMTANYVMEGIIKELLKNKNVLENADFTFVPFIDIDGVQKGDQGKNRHPHDHNRDYIEEPLYSSVKKLKEIGLSSDSEIIFLDLHNPHLYGQWNECVYIVGNSNPKVAEEQKIFCEMLSQVNECQLPFSKDNLLPFGTSWNQTTKDGVSSSTWFGNLPKTKLSASIEIPYAIAKGVSITPQNLNDLGVSFFRAIQKYINV